MTDFLAAYGLFLLQALTLVVLLGLLVYGLRLQGETSPAGALRIKSVNDQLAFSADDLRDAILTPQAMKAERKRRRRAAKQQASDPRPRVFVLHFEGDLMASAVASLRHEVTAVLAVAKPDEDEVVLVLESPGGVVHGYGLAASQLARLRDAGIRLTVCVDKVAASGGYMMACLADHLVAAPFAVIGSIGVVAQIPNVNRLLKRHAVDVELLTAGAYKRTLTVLGENTEAGRAKFQADLDQTHALFKGFVQQWRPQVVVDEVATGEHWFGQQALALNLVDALGTSDDVLREKVRVAQVVSLHWWRHRTLPQRLGLSIMNGLDGLLLRWWQRGVGPRLP